MNTTIKFYTKISKTYDLMNYVVYSERLSKRIIELAEIKEQDKVLDLACGTGWLSSKLEIFKVDIYGLDITPAMLLKAKKMIKGDFVIGCAEALPYSDTSFDVVLCNMAFSHFECHKVIEEIDRVLKQGGRFVVTVSIDPIPSFYDAIKYYPARSIVKLMWLFAGRPVEKPYDSESVRATPEIEGLFGEFQAEMELRYDLLGPAARLKSGCMIIYGRK
jgi:ubiquinone/menaquinone biosynthesis C-methylase UbiE